MHNNRPILLVEDDDVDIMTVRRALKEINVTNELLIANNGEEALTLLNGPGEGTPCIILLDLNMYKMNGIEFLKFIKSEENLKKIPVVVITTSKEKKDKDDAFNMGAAGYMVKPVEYKKYVEILKTVILYWSLSELPD